MTLRPVFLLLLLLLLPVRSWGAGPAVGERGDILIERADGTVLRVTSPTVARATALSPRGAEGSAQLDAVRAILGENALLLDLTGDELDDLRLESSRESLTGSHFRFKQYADGVEILDAGVRATFSPNGVLLFLGESLSRRPNATTRSASFALPPLLAGREVLSRESLYRNVRGAAEPIERFVVGVSSTRRFAYDFNHAGELVEVIPLFYQADAGVRLFTANPVTLLNDPTLRDQDNSASAVPAAAYRPVTLRELETSGPLRGPNVALVDLESPHLPPATLADALPVDRSSSFFEDEMAYYHLDTAQRYLQELGYAGNRQLVAYAIPVDPHAESGADNSHYVPNFQTPGRGTLYFGDGGVDDAEDPDIVLHEYGHAIQDWIAPNAFSGSFGSQSRALAEGISDYLAFSFGYADSVAAGRDPYCIGDWDARCAGSAANNCAYPEGSDCLRRVDRDKTMADFVTTDQSGVEHQNGEIWSNVLRKLFLASTARYGIAAGRTLADRIVLESLFDTPPNPSFATAGRRLAAADAELTGGSFASTICGALRDASILNDACGLIPRGTLRLFPGAQRDVPIPDADPQGVKLVRHVADGRVVKSVRVRVDLLHPHRGDLRLLLIGPNGVPVLLQQTSRADAGSDLHVTFGGDVEPEESLSVFRGVAAGGDWTLQIVDTAGDDVGLLQSWELLLELEGDSDVVSRPDSSATSLFFPIVGHSGTADGRTAVSDLSITNSSPVAAEVKLLFTPYGSDGRFDFRLLRLTLQAGESVTLDDLVSRLFSSSGVGTLELISNVRISAISRVEFSDGRKTLQTISSLESGPGVDAGGVLILPRLENDAAARSNVGIVNRGPTASIIRLQLLDASGSELSDETRSVPPDSGLLIPVRAAGAFYGRISVLEGGRVSGFGSVIALPANDAVLIPAQEPRVPLDVVAAAIRSVGANELRWRSALTLTNPGSVTATVAVEFSSEQASRSRNITLAPGSTVHGEDLLEWLGLERGLGELRLRSEQPVAAALEVVSEIGGDERRELFPLRRRALLSTADATFPIAAALPSRTNLGVINAGSLPGFAQAELRDRSGNLIRSLTVSVAARSVAQQPLGLIEPVAGSVVVRPAPGSQLIPYLSVVDQGDSMIQVGASLP